MPTLTVDRRRRILGLAVPIIGGMVSQNVLNLVDAAMVGSLGDEALAGVGLGGFLNFLLSAFILGVSAGVQVMAARRVGEGRKSETAIPLNGGLLLAVSIALPWSALLVTLAPYYFGLLTGDTAVVVQGWRLPFRLYSAPFVIFIWVLYTCALRASSGACPTKPP